MRVLVLLACAFGLASCALFEADAPPPPPLTAHALSRTPTTADELLAYLARLRALDEARLAQETARQREFARREPGDVARLKVALALAASAQSDESDILVLVEPLVGNGRDTDAQAMASFLLGMALERRRLKESAAAAGNRSRDDRRAMDAQKQRADSLQERVSQLQQKLDALTSLEESLSKRSTQGK